MSVQKEDNLVRGHCMGESSCVSIWFISSIASSYLENKL